MTRTYLQEQKKWSLHKHKDGFLFTIRQGSYRLLRAKWASPQCVEWDKSIPSWLKADDMQRDMLINKRLFIHVCSFPCKVTQSSFLFKGIPQSPPNWLQTESKPTDSWWYFVSGLLSAWCWSHCCGWGKNLLSYHRNTGQWISQSTLTLAPRWMIMVIKLDPMTVTYH